MEVIIHKIYDRNIVTSYRNNYESKMGNRVSKSDKLKLSVKEQRVYGSCCITGKVLQLRCILTTHESGQPNKILSKLNSDKDLNVISINNKKIQLYFRLHIKDMELLQRICIFFLKYTSNNNNVLLIYNNIKI